MAGQRHDACGDGERRGPAPGAQRSGERQDESRQLEELVVVPRDRRGDERERDQGAGDGGAPVACGCEQWGVPALSRDAQEEEGETGGEDGSDTTTEGALALRGERPAGSDPGDPVVGDRAPGSQP